MMVIKQDGILIKNEHNQLERIFRPKSIAVKGASEPLAVSGMSSCEI